MLFFKVVCAVILGLDQSMNLSQMDLSQPYNLGCRVPGPKGALLMLLLVRSPSFLWRNSLVRQSIQNSVEAIPQENPLEDVFIRNGTRPGFGVHYELEVPSKIKHRMRLPDALLEIASERFPSISFARRSIRRRLILVNGVEARTQTEVKCGDVVGIQSRVAPALGRAVALGEKPFDVDVLYEDDHIAIVWKPEGICTFPPKDGLSRRNANASHGNTLAHAILHVVSPPSAGTRELLRRPRPLHRLDRPTSGVLLCAKTYRSHLVIKQAFHNRTVHKEYRAIVCGKVHGSYGTINASIMVNGKPLPAQTKWHVVSRAHSNRMGKGHLTELALFPLTGRTHQLRKHCAHELKSPIVGDLQYGGRDIGEGLFLSAIGLSAPNPDWNSENKRIGVQVDPPRKFARLLQEEQSRWDEARARGKTNT